MKSKKLKNLPFIVVPPIALALTAISWSAQLMPIAMILLGFVLVGTVYVAVHHAEIVALRVGEPFGTLILAVAVTVIEVGMIVVLMLESPETTQNLARDTVFSAVIITANAIAGSALLIKTLKYRVATFRPEGMTSALAVLAALSVLSLVLPSVTTSSSGPTFSPIQLAFAAVTSLGLYLAYVSMQTVRHRDYFLPVPLPNQELKETVHTKPPSAEAAGISFVLLIVSLVSVVGLAKITSPLIKSAVSEAGLPTAVVGVSIAVVVLMPEWLSALRAASFGRMQTSFNLAYGSALASIGLTIPVLAIFSVFFGYQVNLGLGPVETNLLYLTLIVSALTVVSGKATLLQAAVHIGIFATYLLLTFFP